ncbi:MAG: TonB-dependent receptor [Bacteroidetes bacterium]|nr:TonB-dependent receptor [Bacteroidota bacterium]MBL6944221.1 TonB-dependent receptor [Bacteroidales bacterium]
MTVTSMAMSQNIFVYDQQAGNPIPNVVVFNDNKTKTGLTSNLGIADISGFSENEDINFQHPSYVSISLTKNTITGLQFKVPLNGKLINLDEVIVSASRWEIKSSEIPNKIEQIKRKEIIFNNPATSADMLAIGNQVYVQKSQLGGGSPMIRGFATNKILMVVDGVRMNNAIYRSGNLHNVLQADVNSIESAEIIFGPGTNIYGSDALGGVIDFHTLTPKFNTCDKMIGTGNALARLSSADFERTINANFNLSNNSWALMTNISYSKFEDLRMGNMHNDYNQRHEYIDFVNGRDTIIQNTDPNIQRYSGYDQLSIITKIRHKFSENVDWDYSLYLTTTSAVPRYDRLLQPNNPNDQDSELKYAEWNYEPQQWLMNRLSINMHNNASFYDKAIITLAYQNVKEGRTDRKYRDDWLQKREEQVNIFSINTDFDKLIAAGNFIYYGLELVYNDVQSDGVKENIQTHESALISSRYPDGGTKFFQSGVYISYKRNFSSIPLTFLTGLRYSYVSLDSKFKDTTYYQLPYAAINISNGSLTGSAGLVYHPGDWQFNINLSSGFRAPNLDDVAKIFDSEPGNVVVPNENLEPEYLYNLDVGIIKKFSENAKLEITAFYSYLVNAMVRKNFTLNGLDSIMYDGELSRVQAVVNAGGATIYGASMIFNIKLFNNLALSTVLTTIKGKEDTGEPLRHAPPLYGGTKLTFEKNKLKMAVGVDYNTEISYKNLAPSERDKAYLYATDADGNPYSPGWWTLNYNGSYAFNEKFITFFEIDNIMDYRYRTYSSGITAPGRNFKISFRYSF